MVVQGSMQDTCRASPGQGLDLPDPTNSVINAEVMTLGRKSRIQSKYSVAQQNEELSRLAF